MSRAAPPAKYLGQTMLRAGVHPAQVVADFHQHHRQATQRRRQRQWPINRSLPGKEGIQRLKILAGFFTQMPTETAAANSGWQFTPVPTAVPPWGMRKQPLQRT
jgi:hypothetical protein